MLFEAMCLLGDLGLSDHEDRKQTLEIAKLEADIRKANLDRFLRPFQLLTPLILAVGVYLLVQQPNVQGQENAACVAQARFVIDFAKEPETSSDRLRQVFASFPFQCEAARIMANGVVAERSAENSLRASDGIVLRSQDYLSLDLNSVDSRARLCSLNDDVPIEQLYYEVSAVVANLSDSASELERSIADTRSAMQQEELTGKGPRWIQLQVEYEDLGQKLGSLQTDMEKRLQELGMLGDLAVMARAMCE
jgi:hypothetical protein